MFALGSDQLVTELIAPKIGEERLATLTASVFVCFREGAAELPPLSVYLWLNMTRT